LLLSRGSRSGQRLHLRQVHVEQLDSLLPPASPSPLDPFTYAPATRPAQPASLARHGAAPGGGLDAARTLRPVSSGSGVRDSDSPC
jgi:hypothetical protein